MHQHKMHYINYNFKHEKHMNVNFLRQKVITKEQCLTIKGKLQADIFQPIVNKLPQIFIKIKKLMNNYTHIITSNLLKHNIVKMYTVKDLNTIIRVL